jgi:hypothetical protein
MMNTAELVAGQLVQVRTKEEILATLDKRGQLDGLPFMPEMFAFAGKQFPVFKRAHKTCDPPSGIGGRKMTSAVHLGDLRCDGQAHGGCEARCLFFWKEAWLKPVDGAAAGPAVTAPRTSGATATEEDVWAGTRAEGEDPSSPDPVYVCQSTRVPQATQPIRWWDFRQYIEDYTSGNVTLSKMVASFLAYVWHELVMAGFGIGSALRVVYDTFQKARGGTPYPWRFGRIPAGSKTPVSTLNLQPGELVRVKSYEHILETITDQGINRGMSFDAEMVPFCGKTYRVLARINRIINEKTGKMQSMKTACIILEDVVCTACYAAFRRFCPRAIFPYWREIWLERVEPSAVGDPAGTQRSASYQLAPVGENGRSAAFTALRREHAAASMAPPSACAPDACGR